MRWLLRQSLLMRLTVLLLLPAAGIGWMAWGFSVGELVLTFVLLAMWGALDHSRPVKETTDVEDVQRHS